MRKAGFSKDGKHKHPQIVLGLLVSRNAYPLAYDIFEGNKYEGDTFLPILNEFRRKYGFEKLTVIADAGLLSKQNVEELSQKGYEFILGARIKNEKEVIKNAILKLRLKNGESRIINKDGRHPGGRHPDGLRLVITYSEDRAKKDRFNRQRGLKRLEKQLRTGKLNKSGINNKGYNKFLKMEGEVTLNIDQNKVKQDERWDGLKGYLTNSSLTKEEVLENYRHLWQIEKAFRVAKNELRIRPVFHRKRKRIESHICLNFVAYKVYKELERVLKEKTVELSPEKVIDIIQNIYEISLITPDNQRIKRTIILSEEQKLIRKIFGF